MKKFRIDKVRGGWQLIQIAKDGKETKIRKPYRTFRAAEVAMIIRMTNP